MSDNGPKGHCIGYILILCFLFFFSCGAEPDMASPPTDPIRFAFQNRIGSAIPIVAVEKNLFARYGISISPQRFNSGPACAEALYSGSADIGTMGDTTAIIAASRVGDFAIVASHGAGEHRHRLMVREAEACRTLADLRGKKIGVKKGTSTYGGLLKALIGSGIAPAQVDIIDLSPVTMPEALAAGSIDAFAASEPTPSLAELNGGRELMTFGGMENRYPILVLARSAFLLERKEDVPRFFQALRDAEIFIRNQPGETAQLLSKVTGLSLEVARSAMKRHDYNLSLDETIIASLAETARFLREQNRISQIPDFKKVANRRYLEATIKKQTSSE